VAHFSSNVTMFLKVYVCVCVGGGRGLLSPSSNSQQTTSTSTVSRPKELEYGNEQENAFTYLPTYLFTPSMNPVRPIDTYLPKV
jgi:hypothetical protein